MSERTQTLPFVVIVSTRAARRVLNEVAEVLRGDPAAIMPPDLPTLMAMEMSGYVWNFAAGRFEPEETNNDRQT